MSLNFVRGCMRRQHVCGNIDTFKNKNNKNTAALTEEVNTAPFHEGSKKP